MSKTIEVKIEDEELYSAFVRESEELGLSVGDAVAEAIREWLAVLEEAVRMPELRTREYSSTNVRATMSHTKK